MDGLFGSSQRVCSLHFGECSLCKVTVVLLKLEDTDTVSQVWVIQWPFVDSPDHVVLQFFKNTIGDWNPSVRTDLLVNFMLAFSSFGNIIVNTFTYARGECRGKQRARLSQPSSA